MSWACYIFFHSQISSVKQSHSTCNYSLCLPSRLHFFFPIKLLLTWKDTPISEEASSFRVWAVRQVSTCTLLHWLFQHLYHTITHSQRFWQTSQLTLPLSMRPLTQLLSYKELNRISNCTYYPHYLILMHYHLSTYSPKFWITMPPHISEQSYAKKSIQLL